MHGVLAGLEVIAERLAALHSSGGGAVDPDLKAHPRADYRSGASHNEPSRQLCRFSTLSALISLVALILDLSKGKTSAGLLDLATGVIALAIAGGIRFATKPDAGS